MSQRITLYKCSTFRPLYGNRQVWRDDGNPDGNQTTVLTETGVWQVAYNAENRPIRWTQGSVVVTMDYDRLGRRVFYKEMNGNRQVTYTKFLYDGYLCIQQLFSNSPWQYGQRSSFLLHDGNKNVTDVVTVGPFNEPVAHTDYAPFGAPAATGPRATDNPFRFSSEFHDPTLALVYYNYRHYTTTTATTTPKTPAGSVGMLSGETLSGIRGLCGFRATGVSTHRGNTVACKRLYGSTASDGAPRMGRTRKTARGRGCREPFCVSMPRVWLRAEVDG